jgi:AraC-like DNA-binding protein
MRAVYAFAMGTTRRGRRLATALVSQRPGAKFRVYRPKPAATEAPHFQLFQCGINHVSSPQRRHALFMDAMEPRPLATWEYVVSGAMYYQLHGDKHRVEAGQALVIQRPDPGWLVRPCEKGPLHVIWVQVTGPLALEVFGYLHHKYGQVQSFPPECETVRLAKHLIREVARDPYRPAYYWSELTFRWLNAWGRRAEENYHPLKPVPLQAVKPSRLVSYTSKTIKHFAAEMGYSRAYLSQKLKEQWKESPGRVLREVRLREAERLLRTTPMAIGQVAATVGYATAGSFIRAFAKQYRQTPRAYQRMHP